LRHIDAALPANRSLDEVLQHACSGWVQDIIVTLNSTNIAYAVDPYQASQLKSANVIRNLSKMWLGTKLKHHLLLQYHITVVAGSVAGSSGQQVGTSGALPTTFEEFLVALQPQLFSMLTVVFNEIKESIDYAEYVKLCGATHCDITTSKPPYVYVIDGIAKLGGIWSNILLVTITLWSIATHVIPVLQEAEQHPVDAAHV
jgi:hypothetical protein